MKLEFDFRVENRGNRANRRFRLTDRGLLFHPSRHLILQKASCMREISATAHITSHRGQGIMNVNRSGFILLITSRAGNLLWYVITDEKKEILENNSGRK